MLLVPARVQGDALEDCFSLTRLAHLGNFKSVATRGDRQRHCQVKCDCQVELVVTRQAITNRFVVKVESEPARFPLLSLNCQTEFKISREAEFELQSIVPVDSIGEPAVWRKCCQSDGD